MSSVVNGLLATNNDVKTHKVGRRFDFHPKAAFKIEVGSTKNSLNDNKDTGFFRTGVSLVF